MGPQPDQGKAILVGFVSHPWAPLSQSLPPPFITSVSYRCVVAFSPEKADVFLDHWKLLLLTVCTCGLSHEVAPWGRVRNKLMTEL